MRVINVSDMPFEWTWDSGIYGPLAPGEVADLPDEVAAHGVKRSEILDAIGEPTGQYRLKPVYAVKGTPQYEAMVKYRCSICEGGPFGKDDLERHMMESHFSRPAAPTQPNEGKGGSASRPFSRQ